jgi:hypothetical protein
MVSIDDVKSAYRLILGRDPESEEIALRHANQAASLEDLRIAFFCSPEFQTQWSFSAARRRRFNKEARDPDLTSASKEIPHSQKHRVIDIHDREFWARYVPLGDQGYSQVPFEEIGFQRYLTDRGVVVQSMLSRFELALIYALARDYWKGWGAIADLGCLYGLTTRCFAKGVLENNQIENGDRRFKSVYAFDLFLAESLIGYTSASPTLHTGSIFPDFLALNEDLLNVIVPCPGDISRMTWSEPLEILFIDCAKSWELNRWVVEHMFPWLREGSIVVQQDYIHFDEYWVHITMEYFAEYFEPLYMLYGASSVYRCNRAIDPQKTKEDLALLSLDLKEGMLIQAINKAPIPVREVIKCAYAKCLLEHGEIKRARETVESVLTEPLTDDPVLNVAGIAASNKQVVRDMIAKAGG